MKISEQFPFVGKNSFDCNNLNPSVESDKTGKFEEGNMFSHNNDTNENNTENDITNAPTDIKEAAAVMGKLKNDMIFLDKIAKSKTLSVNLLDSKFIKAKKGRDIKTAAEDGLGFLKVRSSFWETSGTGMGTSSNQNSEVNSKKKRA